MDLIQHGGSFRFEFDLFAGANTAPGGETTKAKGMLPNGNARPAAKAQAPAANRCHQRASRRRRSQSQERAKTHRAENGQTVAVSTHPNSEFIAAASKTRFVNASG
jgi:hypothetical protein